MDLNKVRKTVSVKADESTQWKELLGAVDAIIANKQYLIIADNIRREREGNEEFLAAIRVEIADSNVELAAIQKKIRAANEYLDTGYKKREAELEKALETFGEVKKQEINDSLSASREELKSVRADVTEARTEFDEIKAKVRELQKDLSDMFVG